MPVTECIAVYIRLSSEDNDVDGSIKARKQQCQCTENADKQIHQKQDRFINCSVVEYEMMEYSGTNFNRQDFRG